jgi:hypothetical protein
MYRPAQPELMASGQLGESAHLATVRAGQGMQRAVSNMDTDRYVGSAAMQRAASDMHHGAVQAERRAILPMTQQAAEAITLSGPQNDPRVREALLGAKTRAMRNLGSGQSWADLGAMAAGGVIPVAA